MDIKFRAWDRKKKQFDTCRNGGDIVSFSLDYKGIQMLRKEGYKIYQQFTGLLDKNGKEIFAGDIVKHSSKAYTPFENSISVVEWFDDNFCYIFRKKHTKEDEKDKQVYDTERIANAGGGCGIDFYPEIVGNIYNNPELLK